ncbi:hypothetical protein JTB14_017196 [Gonioctena quinquepunctata]|nr:hypothetical protein JTB14_017196 [Gonioctena quinquepunctata]
MNGKQEKQLFRWFDEVETEDDGSESDAKSTHDAYRPDDSIDDPEYTRSISSYSSSDLSDEQAGSESSGDDPSEQENNVWKDTLFAPIDFMFNHASVGFTQNIESKTSREVFELT